LTTIEKVRQRAEADAKTYGYYLNPDDKFLQDLLDGLKRNEERFGYPACPCRLASGNLDIDRDIICPCDYRDPDVADYGTCYCALYVRKDVHEGSFEVQPVPERRPTEKQVRSYEVQKKASETQKEETTMPTGKTVGINKKLWYCKQCGYVVYREDPPYVCPICKAKRVMFAELVVGVEERG
jgi:ferredoxin-thioredoxin reductase catalytic subunit